MVTVKKCCSSDSYFPLYGEEESVVCLFPTPHKKMQ